MTITIKAAKSNKLVKACKVKSGSIYSPEGENSFLIPIDRCECSMYMQSLLVNCDDRKLEPFFCLETLGIILIKENQLMYCQIEHATVITTDKQL